MVRITFLLLFISLLIHINVMVIGLKDKVLSVTEDEAWGIEDSEHGIQLKDAHPWRISECKARDIVGRKVQSSPNGTGFSCYPDFMFIGASKCGTTSIASYLTASPMIRNFNPEDSETHIFDHVNSKPKKLDLMMYNQMPIYNLSSRHLLMEYTPNYLLIDGAPERIKAAFPNTFDKLKFIVIIRDPVARTISSLKFKAVRSKKKEKENYPKMTECVDKGIAMGNCLENCYNSGTFNMSDNSDCNIEHCRLKYDDSEGYCGGLSMNAHVVKSMYAYQLMNWFKSFDRSQFLIISLEQYIQKPIWYFEKMLNFLGLPLYDPAGMLGFKDRKSLIEVLKVHKNTTPKDADTEAQVTEQMKQQLTEFFRPHNKLLIKLLGWDPGYPS